MIGLLVAVVTDIREQRIPNLLTGPLMLVGLVGNAVLADGIGLWAAFTGWGIAFVLHFLLTVLGLEGAGDGKLMMAVGAFVGWEMMVEATVWRYLLLLPYALAVVIVMRRWRNFLAAALWTQRKLTGGEAGERPEATEMPFAPIIAIAVPIAMQTDWIEGWLWST